LGHSFSKRNRGIGLSYSLLPTTFFVTIPLVFDTTNRSIQASSKDIFAEAEVLLGRYPEPGGLAVGPGCVPDQLASKPVKRAMVYKSGC
jgi:hypothetical protein